MDDDGGCEQRLRMRKLSAQGSAECGVAPCDSEAAWHEEWLARFECWWLATPYSAALQACWGALGITLARRFEAMRSGGGAPASQMAAEPTCDWVESNAAALQLPQFPQLSDGVPYDFKLPPIPRLLPQWQQLHSAQPTSDGTDELVLEQGGAALMPIAVGGASGFALGGLILLGLSLGRSRNRGRPALRQGAPKGATKAGVRA